MPPDVCCISVLRGFVYYFFNEKSAKTVQEWQACFYLMTEFCNVPSREGRAKSGTGTATFWTFALKINLFTLRPFRLSPLNRLDFLYTQRSKHARVCPWNRYLFSRRTGDFLDEHTIQNCVLTIVLVFVKRGLRARSPAKSVMDATNRCVVGS